MWTKNYAYYVTDAHLTELESNILKTAKDPLVRDMRLHAVLGLSKIIEGKVSLFHPFAVGTNGVLFLRNEDKYIGTVFSEIKPYNSNDWVDSICTLLEILQVERNPSSFLLGIDPYVHSYSKGENITIEKVGDRWFVSYSSTKEIYRNGNRFYYPSKIIFSTDREHVWNLEYTHHLVRVRQPNATLFADKISQVLEFIDTHILNDAYNEDEVQVLDISTLL